MLRNEYIDSFAFGDTLVNIGMDDNGQSYFLEWACNGELKQLSCGGYYTNYKEVAEYEFGDPERDCPYYKDRNMGMGDCPYNKNYGYCANCPYEDTLETSFQTLVKLGILDRRGNVTDKFKDIIVKKEAPSPNKED